MKELFRRLATRPGISGELVVASLFANALALASPLFVIQVLNRYVAHGVDATLATLTAGVLMAIILEFAFRQVRMRLAGGLSRKPDETMSLGAFGVLTGARVDQLERLSPSLRREVMNGAATVESAYAATNVTAVLDVPFALLFIGVLFLLKPILAGIAASFLVAVFLLGTLVLASLRGPAREMVSVSGTGGAIVGTAVDHADTVRAFNAAGFLRQAWEENLRHLQALRRRVTARQGLVQSITQSAAALMNVAIIATGATLVVRGEFDVGAMIGANILASRALGPVSRFAQLAETFAKARQSLELLREFARLPMELTTGSAKRTYRGALELRDVAFTFSGSSTPLFESLSLTLEPGAVLVVTGANGTGKTTLARILVGLLEPGRGHILVDGLDLRQVVPEWWRKQVVYLPQEPAFLNATVEENLRLANPDIDTGGLNRIIDAGGLRRFIDESSGGLDTPITGNGNSLSPGIRRRLALARALATEGMLAVIDEPTEGMDAEGAAAVTAAINDLARRGRTVIIVSHEAGVAKGAQFVIDLNRKPKPKVTGIPQPLQPRAEAASEGNTAP